MVKNFNIIDLLNVNSGKIKEYIISLDENGILDDILPELTALKGVDNTKESSHKDNYIHTLEVVKNAYYATNNIYIRLVAILHDIGKAKTKKWVDNIGWTFHNHEYKSGEMLKNIFNRLSIPEDKYDYVYKLIINHGFPKELDKRDVSDSALRRFGKDMGEDLEDLILFCKCDLTSKNIDKKNRQIKAYNRVYENIIRIRREDKLSEWRNPVDGNVIMEYFNVKGKIIGEIKYKIETAIKSGEIGDNYEEAFEYMKSLKI